MRRWAGRGVGAAGRACPRNGGAGVWGALRTCQAEELLTPPPPPRSPSPGALCSWDELEPREFEPQPRNAQLWVWPPLPAPCAALTTLSSGLCHLCLFVSGGFPFLPHSAPRRGGPGGGLPTAFSHTHSLTLFPVCKLSSGVRQRQQQEKPAPAPPSRRLPSPVLPSPARHPQFLQGPPTMSDPDVPRGPDVPAMWLPCSRGA